MPTIIWRPFNDAPRLTKATLTGILVAVTGNVLISFALNLQKLAHKRLDNTSSASRQANGHATSTNDPDTRLEYGSISRSRSPKRSFPVNQEEASLLCPGEQTEHWNESRYLKSKLWWLGFLLMNVGEAGNFISYAFAPASVVAPLGTFALMSNCVFAPFMLGERFKKRDLVGILLAIIGAITVVLSSNSSDTRMNQDALRKAVTQLPFIVYSIAYVAGMLVLATLSHGKIGQRWVFVDVGLCALFGGFTVLSTKALSTLLTTDGALIFTEWITYPILLVLVVTGVGQIRYLNRGLMRFDSKVVIPIQFVLFTLSAIIGSAILYGDFQKATFHQTVTFLYGVGATFAGVFTIAWAGPSTRPDDDELSVGDPTVAVSTSHEYRVTQGKQCGVLVTNSNHETVTLKHKRSTMDMITLSPAKHLLLVEREQVEVAPGPEVGGIAGTSDHDLRISSSFQLRGNTSFCGFVGSNTNGGYAR